MITKNKVMSSSQTIEKCKKSVAENILAPTHLSDLWRGSTQIEYSNIHIVKRWHNSEFNDLTP